MGLVPANAQVGDAIMVLYGASVPIALRKLSISYRLVGECYIHGAMDVLKGEWEGHSFRLSGSSTTVKPQIVSHR
jgi:hypothetical protein